MPRNKYTEQFAFEQVDNPTGREQTDWAEEVMKLNIWIVVGITAAHTLITGCAAGGGADPEPQADAYCDEVFRPDPEIGQLVTDALKVWSEATGKTLCVRDYGTPVILQDIVLGEADGKELCGVTDVDYFNNSEVNFVAVSLDNLGGRCVSLQQTIAHELGHAISRTPLGKAYHLPDDMYGVMSAWPNSLTTPNSADVALVCRHTDCYF